MGFVAFSFKFIYDLLLGQNTLSFEILACWGVCARKFFIAMLLYSYVERLCYGESILCRCFNLLFWKDFCCYSVLFMNLEL